MTAGQDATEAFYGLHRHDVITKPQYARLQVGVIEGEKSVIHSNIKGELSKVPYAEPTWLTEGYFSPYYNQVCPRLVLCTVVIINALVCQSHRRFQKFMREFTDEIVTPDAVVGCQSPILSVPLIILLQAREEDGKPPSASVVEAMA